MTKPVEIHDYKLRAYRTIREGDKRFQNWQQSSTVLLELYVEIDGIEIPLVSHAVQHQVWERSIKNYEKPVTPALSSGS